MSMLSSLGRRGSNDESGSSARYGAAVGPRLPEPDAQPHHRLPRRRHVGVRDEYRIVDAVLRGELIAASWGGSFFRGRSGGKRAIERFHRRRSAYWKNSPGTLGLTR